MAIKIVDIERIDGFDSGEITHCQTERPVFSSDGSQIAFFSHDNPNSGMEGFGQISSQSVYVKNIASGHLSRLDVGPITGTDSPVGGFSPDGTKLIFSSADSTLVAGDNNQISDLFIKDLVTSEVTRLDIIPTDQQLAYGVKFPLLSQDGQQLAFKLGEDMFVRNLETGVTVQVNTTASGQSAQGDHTSRPLSFSPDGTKILFSSSEGGLSDGYEFGERLYIKDIITGAINKIAKNPFFSSTPSDAKFSPDGSKIIFSVQGTGLTPDDTNQGYDVFTKDLITGQITRISVNKGGYSSGQVGSTTPDYSPDATKVIFASDNGWFFPAKGSLGHDIYIKDLATEKMEPLGLNALMGGVYNPEFISPHISSNGKDILFANTGNLGAMKSVFIAHTVAEGTIGTDAGETLAGNDSSNTIFGMGGNDVISGGGGNDVLIGGTGNHDILRGGQGDDALRDMDGVDYVNGGFGNDAIQITFHKNWVNTGGTASENQIYGGSGNDVIKVTLNNSEFRIDIDGDTPGVSRSSDGSDIVAMFGSYKSAFVQLKGGNDGFYGDLGADHVLGGAGNDFMSTGEGNDQLIGGLGDDTLIGGYGDDLFSGGRGDDLMNGQMGDDILDGGLGNDLLLGGGGDDRLYGGEGDDQLFSGDFKWSMSGVDTLTGGSGADKFVFSYDSLSNATITDFRSGEGDKIDISTGPIRNFETLSTHMTQDGQDTLIHLSQSTMTHSYIRLLGIDHTQLTEHDFLM